MTAKSKNKKPGRRRPYVGAVLLVLRVAAVCGVLAAVTLLISATAAVVAVALGLWAALYIALRRLQTANKSAERVIQNSRDKYDAVIGSLTTALELDDDMRGDHIARVRQLAGILAAEMGMRKDDVCLLQKAALLADCGKVEIAQGILTKAGALTEQEWAQMKRHPEFGFEFLNSIRHLRDCGDIVRSHHERFDGQGYPRGLKGEAIPLGARIFSVVDAYTAMTSDRPHRKKMPHEMAIKEILRNSLTQFDPEVVRAFQRCEERGEITGTAGEAETTPRADLLRETPAHVPATAASAA
jgi:HD-GYP domain-containing protein (c-di-GMP phosphodiesterase class II)